MGLRLSLKDVKLTTALAYIPFENIVDSSVDQSAARENMVQFAEV